MNAKHTPVASLEISLRIGQRVRLIEDHHGKRITGIVRALGLSDHELFADISLDEPIVIPPRGDDDHELRIYHQHVPALEVAPFDERDELIETLTKELGHAARFFDQLNAEDAARYRAAIAKARGAA